MSYLINAARIERGVLAPALQVADEAVRSEAEVVGAIARATIAWFAAVKRVEILRLNTGAYIFPALRIHQAEHHYYLIQCPLRLIPRLLLFDAGEVPASIRRAQALDPASVAS